MMALREVIWSVSVQYVHFYIKQYDFLSAKGLRFWRLVSQQQMKYLSYIVYNKSWTKSLPITQNRPFDFFYDLKDLEMCD